MKKETRLAIRELAYYSSLGFSVSFSIFIGFLILIGESCDSILAFYLELIY